MRNLLNHQTIHRPSEQRLDATYRSGLIAAEKKPFLIDLTQSSGPFLAIEQGNLICDGASQIASLGLGLNASALFGAAEHLESWINDTESDNFSAIRQAYQQLLQRQLGSDRFSAHFCGSGAEGIETALAHCFTHRSNPKARKVLAFEGSFHGRMMVALASTWNRAKREPFSWPGHESVFAPYPEMDTSDIGAPSAPAGWVRLWSELSAPDFEEALLHARAEADGLLGAEIDSLLAVRKHLESGDVFAILIEPMQCEGGDRYSSARFHQGLACLATALNVPLVYDEIQTGFGLGGEFFWHRMFDLRLANQQPFFPAAVVCAKKAQTGLVLTLDSAPAATGQYSTASLIRGYIQASVIHQFQKSITLIEETNRQQLGQLLEDYGQAIGRPRVQGLAFAFDLTNPELLQRFVGHRFEHGLLFYPAGEKTARFRMNLGFQAEHILLFWAQLRSVLKSALNDESPSPAEITVRPRDTTNSYAFHELLLDQKLDRLKGDVAPGKDATTEFLGRQLERSLPETNLEIVVLNEANYGDFRAKILQLQTEVYEPARQSSAAEFDALFATENPLSILLLQDHQIVAMAFGGPLEIFRDVRGVETDPHLHDPTVAYMLDLTVVEQYRGRLGRVLKQALTILALERGYTAMHGRNRDRLAAGMWAINLSLGSYTTKYLPDDYPDTKPFRDCIYYRCPTVWSQPPINLSAGIEMPLGISHLDVDFVHNNLSALVNKITLSNFVTEQFLDQIDEVAKIFPAELRHLYTANGLSECIDKIAKVLWRHRQPRTGLLTIEGHEFGSGSLLARSLSGIGDPFFKVNRLPTPTGPEDQKFFNALESRLQEDDLLAMFVEPLMRQSMGRLPLPVLERVVQSCREYGVPVVFNESASLFYRYSEQSFTASGNPQIQPDAAVAYLGGQMALVATTKHLFIDKPLMFISTWDGDAFSLSQFHRAMATVQADPNTYFSTMATFHQNLSRIVQQNPRAASELERGIGYLTGTLPESIAPFFRQAGKSRWRSCPSYSEMLRFNKTTVLSC
ncbi:MAG: aminotransferase class III-fold pyridoxal phosphate-dependent enzyme [Pirellulales bacterium]|nr:aminotransferase class III-fold pyridoxal phosphate-dependent enzyme [Pirellulales bacterium]